MNRSFRASEPQVQRQGRNLGSMMKEKEEELALFLEMRKREKERNNLLLLHGNEDFETPLGSKPGSSPIFKIVSPTPHKSATDDFLNSDNDKNDYDWLLTPPGTPLFPSLEMESNKPSIGQIGTPKARPTALKSRLANPLEPITRGSLASRQSALSSGLNSSGVRRPSSSGGPGSVASRPATPTGRPTMFAPSKPSRPSTPTSRATIPFLRTAPPSTRSTTPARRSSTPTARPSLTAPKAPSRSATPTRRPSTPSSVAVSSVPPARSSSVTKSSPAGTRTPAVSSVTKTPSAMSMVAKTPSAVSSATKPTSSMSSVTKSTPLAASRNQVASHGNSPTVKARPWKPSEMPGFSLDAPPNLRTSLPDRPLSALRGRPGAPSARSSSVDAGSNGRTRRQSCSPSRGRAPNGSRHVSGSSVPAASRLHSNGSDSLSPVLIGTKMVERVINMRRLAPPSLDDQRSAQNSLAGKSTSSPDSSGFGRTLSKKSLDMALRHMDIRRSNSGSLRPLMTNIPASSMYSVRSGSARSRTISVPDSPLATSSNASSEQSVNNNNLCLDGSEIEDDDMGSQRGVPSPASQRGR